MELDKNFDNDDKMNEEEMNQIIKYISDLDFDKYQKDLEIREAFQLLKNKIKKEEKEKQILTETNGDNSIKQTVKNKEIEDLSINQQQEASSIQEEEKKPLKELTDEEKIMMEQNWNSSVINYNNNLDKCS